MAQLKNKHGFAVYGCDNYEGHAYFEDYIGHEAYADAIESLLSNYSSRPKYACLGWAGFMEFHFMDNTSVTLYDVMIHDEDKRLRAERKKHPSCEWDDHGVIAGPDYRQTLNPLSVKTFEKVSLYYTDIKEEIEKICYHDNLYTVHFYNDYNVTFTSTEYRRVYREAEKRDSDIVYGYTDDSGYRISMDKWYADNISGELSANTFATAVKSLRSMSGSPLTIPAKPLPAGATLIPLTNGQYNIPECVNYPIGLEKMDLAKASESFARVYEQTSKKLDAKAWDVLSAGFYKPSQVYPVLDFRAYDRSLVVTCEKCGYGKDMCDGEINWKKRCTRLEGLFWEKVAKLTNRNNKTAL